MAVEIRVAGACMEVVGTFFFEQPPGHVDPL